MITMNKAIFVMLIWSILKNYTTMVCIGELCFLLNLCSPVFDFRAHCLRHEALRTLTLGCLFADCFADFGPPLLNDASLGQGLGFKV